ncbi:DUF6368 family protein [Streptomyces sp. NBC_01187]|uniref:DUF6368 family protein n=1 Tax=Streptomyces sp. NBC_01187 TaxID=2903766 RepID=UPI00386682E2|nr:DUF6368 family protein [Streptomyces sp. NBC_01187]
MGGPSVGLWLPEERSALDAVPWLEDFCGIRPEGDGSGAFDFSVLRTASLDRAGLPRLRGPEEAAVGPFHLGPESLEDERACGFPGLGRPPAVELALLAYSSGPDNHLLLGHLALFLGEHFDALIDFGGLLSPLPRSPLPGRLLEMPYAMEDGTPGYSHVADRVFLRAWLGREGFRMVK